MMQQQLDPPHNSMLLHVAPVLDPPVFTMLKPNLADMDGDGVADLVVGRQGGHISYLENVGSGTFVERGGPTNQFEIVHVGKTSAPAGADWDGDRDLDCIVGQQSGSFSYYENIGNDFFLNEWADVTFSTKSRLDVTQHLLL